MQEERGEKGEKVEKKKKRKKKLSRFETAFSMRFDAFTLAMLDRIAWDEDKTRPEVIRAAMKYLFLKKYEKEELDRMREKHRGNHHPVEEEQVTE